MMGFAQPLQLLWAAAMIVVVLLYLRWARRNTIATATLPIWEHALSKRTLWSRWRQAVSIAAACVPIVLIALALAQPFLWPVVHSARTMIVVVDVTASMKAKDGERSRLAEAKRRTRRLIENLRTHEQMAILSADSAVHVRCGTTGDKTLLLATVSNIQPTDGTGAMPGAVATAQRLAADQPHGTVVVVSDVAFAGIEELSASDKVVWMPVGSSAANVAITRFAARPHTFQAGKCDALVELANFSDTTVDVPLEVGPVASAMAKTNVEIPAGKAVQRVMSVELKGAGELVAHIQHDDALPADNIARMLVTPHLPTRVILVSKQKNSLLESALRSIQGVELNVTDTIPVDVGNSTVSTILVVDGDEFGAAELQTIPPYPTLVIGPTGASELWLYDGEIASPGGAVQQGHVVLQDVDFGDVVIDKAANLRVSDDAEVIATGSDRQPFCAIVPRSEGDVIVLAFSPAGSDLALRDVFVQFLAAAIDWLGRANGAEQVQWTTASTIDLPDIKMPMRLTSPYGVHRDAKAGQSLLANLPQVGQWQVAGDAGSGEAVLPVSMLNGDESDLRPRADNASTAWPASTRLPDIGPLASIFIALGLVWIVGHWVFYQRGDID